MMSVNFLPSLRTGNAGRGRYKNAAAVLVLSLLLPFSLRGQTPNLLQVEGEEPLYALHRSDPALTTPAEAVQFVIIRGAEVSRIITLHHGTETGLRPGTITLFNINGEFTIGTWEAAVEAVPGEDNLFYWVVFPNKNIPPGRYQVIDSDPATWVNSAGTNQEGMTWVFSRIELSL